MIKIQDLPETLPKLDFAEYKAKLPGLSSMVSEFEKQYQALEVPYPKDTQNIKEALKKEEVAVREKSASYIESETKHIHSLQTMLKKIDSVPPPEKMTRQMFNHYFPEHCMNPNYDNPGFHPHFDPENQLQNLRKRGRSLTFAQAPGKWNINLVNLADFEQEWFDKVIEWQKEETQAKIKPIVVAYRKIVDSELEKHCEKMSVSEGKEAVKAFMKDKKAQSAFAEKVLAENGITKEKYMEECAKIVGPLNEIKSVKDYLDALVQK